MDIFQAVRTKKNNAMFLIVGEGAQAEQLKQYASKNGLAESVQFLGRRDDVNSLMMVFNVFFMPSLYEGLPVVEVEAQAAGLRCVISDKVPAINLINRMSIVPLSESDNKWSEIILEEDSFKRESATQMVIDNNYDITTEAKKLEEFYLGL